MFCPYVVIVCCFPSSIWAAVSKNPTKLTKVVFLLNLCLILILEFLSFCVVFLKYCFGTCRDRVSVPSFTKVSVPFIVISLSSSLSVPLLLPLPFSLLSALLVLLCVLCFGSTVNKRMVIVSNGSTNRSHAFLVQEPGGELKSEHARPLPKPPFSLSLCLSDF